MFRSHALRAPAAAAGARRLAPALALSLAVFLTQLDVTAVVVVMPSIGAELGFGSAGFAWVMDAYSLAFTALLLAAGALADRHGRRLAMLHGNALFALGSLGCGLAWNGPSLWIARGVQGAGAAFVVTGAIALIAGLYAEPTERARAFGLMGVVSGMAMALGPTLGGLVGAWFGWRWIFLANLPIGLMIAVAVPRLIRETRDAGGPPLDPVGILQLTAALGVAIVALLQGARAPAVLFAGLLASATLGALFITRQRRLPRPLLDPDLFARPAMAGVAILLLSLSVGYWAVLVYLPLFLRTGFGLTPEQVGFALLAATLPMLVLPPMAGRLVIRWGWPRLFATGLAAVVAGDLVLAWTSLGAGAGAGFAPGLLDVTRFDLVPFGLALVGMVLIGLGTAMVHSQLSAVVVTLAPPSQAGMASAVTVVLRQAGFALGIAALGAAETAKGFPAAFLLAAAASLGGVAAALFLLPGPASRPAE
ncbi:MFS transporter [Phreatobacter stygius]|uniref:MFS transporter n=1 Tax=Phreatobacter stygius TaxID=1940610 RepID=A0A4D7BDY5_9HYPH|nr:MFS transporter [Phreatobacter stygius]QCI68723.1 MFS transporter [Phreatobacter stygius]